MNSTATRQPLSPEKLAVQDALSLAYCYRANISTLQRSILRILEAFHSETGPQAEAYVHRKEYLRELAGDGIELAFMMEDRLADMMKAMDNAEALNRGSIVGAKTLAEAQVDG